jgi:hypothetical protein
MTQPLPAGCIAPKMSDEANAQLQGKILSPPAIWAWRQQLRQRTMSVPITITYTLNGHPGQATFSRQHGPAWYEEVRRLRNEGAENIKISGLGTGATMPSNLQKLQERETQDASGRYALYINPAAIPAGIGLSIGVDITSPDNFNIGVDLVVTSPACTGS